MSENNELSLDSAGRWCDICKRHGSHHTDRHDEMSTDPDWRDKAVEDGAHALCGRSERIGFTQDGYDAQPASEAARRSNPDHPEMSCENCGHESDCSTHNGEAGLEGPCDCSKNHWMITGSHERMYGPECHCGAPWDRWNSRCSR